MPLLCMGTILAIFKGSGKIPVSIAEFIITDSGKAIADILVFITLSGISSTPKLLLLSSFSTILIISLQSVGRKTHDFA